MKVGVAGCGRMGLPMARALSRQGISVLGFDVRRDDDFPGVDMQFDPVAFAAACDVIFTVVRTEDQTEDLLFRDQGILAHVRSQATLVVSSTLRPAFVMDLVERLPNGIDLIDAPMSGAAVAAEEARLSFMIGGDAGRIDELMLLFSAMGDRFHLMGGIGTGMTAKVLNNLVGSASLAATRTALAWGMAAGVAPERLRAVMHDSSGQTWFGTHFDNIEFARDGFAPGNTIEIVAKDLECALSVAPDGADTGLTEALIRTVRALEPYEG